MERNTNESFAAYKVRRAAANRAVKNINRESRSGAGNPRAKRMGNGMYGKTLATHFAKQRATPAMLWNHRMHVAHMAIRKAERAAANDSRLMRAA